jgi:nitroreductase
MEQQPDIVNHVIRTRRSIFPQSYIKKEIPREIIETLLENANYAPTHKLTEPWRFIVFSGDGLNKLAHFLSERYRRQTPPESFSQARYDAAGEKVLQSSHVIAINVALHPDKLPEWEEIASVACAVQNIWLSASAYGIGSYWSSPGFLGELAEYLEIPEDQKCIGLYYLGYHEAGEIAARRTPIEGKVTWME